MPNLGTTQLLIEVMVRVPVDVQHGEDILSKALIDRVVEETRENVERRLTHENTFAPRPLPNATVGEPVLITTT